MAEPLDRFSLLHVLVGAAYGRAGLGRTAAYSLLIGWQVFEDRIRARFPNLPHRSQDVASEPIRSKIVDALTGMAAFEVAKR